MELLDILTKNAFWGASSPNFRRVVNAAGLATDSEKHMYGVSSASGWWPIAARVDHPTRRNRLSSVL